MPVAWADDVGSNFRWGAYAVRSLRYADLTVWTNPDPDPPPDDPDPSGFPSPANTGCRVPEDELDVVVGTWQSSSASQTVENTIIRGRVVVRHSGVTFTDCVIESTFMGDFRGNYPIDLANQGNGPPTGVEFNYCTIRGAAATLVASGVQATASTDRLTFPSSHGLVVDSPIYLTANTAGGLQNIGYYVRNVVDSTNVTLCRLVKGSTQTNVTSNGTCTVWRFNHSPELPALYCEDGASYTMDRCRITNLRSGVRTGTGGNTGYITIQDSYIFPNMGPSPSDAHRSAVALDGSQRIKVLRNTLLTDQPYSSGCAQIYAQDGPPIDIEIDGNLLGTTGSFAIYGGVILNDRNPYGSQASYIRITDNTVLAGNNNPWRPLGGLYGPNAYCSRTPTGNVFDGNVISGGPYDGIEFPPNPGTTPWDGTPD